MPKGVYKKSEEYRKKVSERQKERYKLGLLKIGQKGSKLNVGRKQSPEHIAKRFSWRKDYKVSEETKRKIGLANSKWEHPKLEEHPNWMGGKSFEPYSISFTKQLKESIRIRDNRICQICSKKEGKEKLSIHHIDYNKLNTNKDNLISLCRSCHIKTNYERSKWVKYFYEKRFV